jgi:hypothetical protein
MDNLRSGGQELVEKVHFESYLQKTNQWKTCDGNQENV